MAGLDRTGPRGQGPFTGGGRGYCVGYPAQGNVNERPMRDGCGFIRGYGRGRGFGRGFGWRWVVSPYAYGALYGSPYGGPAISAQDEASALKEEAREMQDEIAAINQRIKELESNAASDGNE